MYVYRVIEGVKMIIQQKDQYNSNRRTRYNQRMMKTIEGYSYKVGEYVGKGYTSTVHRGVCDATGQAVAIKVIEMSKLEDPLNHMLLQLEVEALKSLAHSSHVLHLLNVYATKNNTYLVTELCESDLARLIRQRKTIPYLEAVQILRQLIIGYLDIHRAGFIHRDVKPANILHRGGVFKFADFGFAIKALDLNEHRAYNVGSPVYMPPQALKANLYSVSSDTWALGIIFYQMLHGVVPWRSLNEKALHEKMLTTPIHHFTSTLPQPARVFFSLVLSIDPANRLTPQQLTLWPDRLAAIVMPTQGLLQSCLLPDSSSAHKYDIKVIRDPSIVDSKTLKEIKGIRSTQNISFNYKVQKENKGQIRRVIHPNQVRFPIQNECLAFFTDFIKYLRFVHRVIKFVGAPTAVPLPALMASLTKQLHLQMQKAEQMLDGRIQVRLDEWKQFAKGEHRELKECVAYYRMFCPLTEEVQQAQQPQIREGIKSLMAHLDEMFDAKAVIAADYLTTYLQLKQLEDSLETIDFVRRSNIDLIMQGCPYFVTEEHLTKLRSKLIAMRI